MKTQISTSVAPIVRQRADELVSDRYGTMSTLLSILISAEYIKHQGAHQDKLPKLTVGNMEVVHINDLEIKMADGSLLSHGYKLSVALQYDGRETMVDACNLLVTVGQSTPWCIEQCERLRDQLAQKNSYTPGQILKMVKGCGFQPFNNLGIPTPPQQKYATKDEGLEFYRKTGTAMMYFQNDLYREWAIAYNAWIREHPRLAEDYGCTFQDENWKPVQ